MFSPMDYHVTSTFPKSMDVVKTSFLQYIFLENADSLYSIFLSLEKGAVLGLTGLAGDFGEVASSSLLL